MIMICLVYDKFIIQEDFMGMFLRYRNEIEDYWCEKCNDVVFVFCLVVVWRKFYDKLLKLCFVQFFNFSSLRKYIGLGCG